MSSSAERQEERVRLGLIAYVSQHTVDPDYAARSRRGSDGTSGTTTASRLAATAVLALFAVLVVTAATQTHRSSSSDARERAELINQVDSRRTTLQDLDARAHSLSSDNDALRTGLGGGSVGSGQLRRLRIDTGAVAVTGPGVVMVADDKIGATDPQDRVGDKDLQRLVNGLWEAGAQAISINAQRITTLTAIRQAGGVINVNYIPVQRPYTVRAIGDPDTLASRFAESTSGASWFDLVDQVGLRLRITTAKRLDLARSDQLGLRYAEGAKGGSS